MATDLTTLQAAAVVDARGSACPGPLLEAKKAIGRVKVGEVLEVLSNDPGTKSDMPLWAQKVGHEFLGSLAADGYDRILWSERNRRGLRVALLIIALGIRGTCPSGSALPSASEVFARLCTSADAKEGIEAFLGKRKPEWQGSCRATGIRISHDAVENYLCLSGNCAWCFSLSGLGNADGPQPGGRTRGEIY